MASWIASAAPPQRIVETEDTPMKWMLVERKPDVVYSGGQETYLGADDREVFDTALAKTFDTRQDAEAHRRNLKHRYHWVAVTVPQ